MTHGDDGGVRGLLDAVQTGSRRDVLQALGELLAVVAADAEPKEVAGLSRELRAVLADLDALPEAREVSPLDDLANRRAARLADAAGL